MKEIELSQGEMEGSLAKIYEEAKELILEEGKVSPSFLQRRMNLNYACASRIVDELEKNGVIGPEDGAKPREVLI